MRTVLAMCQPLWWVPSTLGVRLPAPGLLEQDLDRVEQHVAERHLAADQYLEVLVPGDLDQPVVALVAADRVRPLIGDQHAPGLPRVAADVRVAEIAEAERAHLVTVEVRVAELLLALPRVARLYLPPVRCVEQAAGRVYQRQVVAQFPCLW